MRKPKTILFAVLACLGLASGARGQYYWREVTPKADSGYTYYFSAVDCSGEVCTATGVEEFSGKQAGSIRWNVVCFRSIDGGATWIVQDPGLPHVEFENATVFAEVEQIDSLNAVAAGNDSGIIVKTTDGGNTWVRIDLPIPDTEGTFYFGGFHFSDPMTGIATLVAAQDNIFTTSDGGTTWNRSPWHPWLPATMCHSDGGENFRVITYEDGPLYYTSDNWNTVDSTSIIFPYGESNPGDTGFIALCEFLGQDTLVGYGDRWSDTAPSTHYPLIMTSTDNGVHWNSISQSSYGEIDYVKSMSSLDRDIVFADGLVNGRQILVSTDHGMSWKPDTLAYAYTGDTLLREISAIAVTADNHGIAIMGQEPNELGESIVSTLGEPKLMLGEPLAKVETSPMIDSNVQVFPNPSSSSITITSFELGSTVHLLDILGREVMHAPVPAGGQLTLDVLSLPSGLYYITDGITRAKFVKE